MINICFPKDKAIQVLFLDGIIALVFKGNKSQICPGLNANEIQIPYDKHHKVSSLVKSHLNTILSNMK